MKMGDEMAVMMDGLHVANAIIEEVDRDAGEVTMYIPATRFIVGLAESIVDKNPESTRELLTDEGLEARDQQYSRANEVRREAVDASERPQDSIVEPRRSDVGPRANKELEEAYRSTTSLSEMNLDSRALD